MFKILVVIFAIIACAIAKPGLIAAPLAVPAPAVTASSSQFIARNYNGIATAPVVASVASPVIAKYTTAYTSPLAYSSPLTYSALSPSLVYSELLTYAAAAPAQVLL